MTDLKFQTRQLLIVLLVVTFILIPTSGVFAASTADVIITATPSFVSITNDVDSWPVGLVAESTTYWWSTPANTAPAPEPFTDGDMAATVTNGGSVNVTLTIHNHNFTGGAGWTVVNTSVGANIVMLAAGVTGTANAAAMKFMNSTTPIELYHELWATSNNTIKWCMQLQTGTFTDGAVKTDNVTVTATVHVP